MTDATRSATSATSAAAAAATGLLQRRIFKMNDMNGWKNSQAYERISFFIAEVNQAIMGFKQSEAPSSLICGRITSILEFMIGLVGKNPPVPMGRNQRYGNPTFRQYYSQLENVDDFESREQLEGYLMGSVGNPIRIDYGTGHELSFIGFLTALRVIKDFEDDDLKAIGLCVVPKYLEFVRLLQNTYSLEPAGSHGVWGLDDYQFIPFMWGSAQLTNQSEIEPSMIFDKDILEEYSADYMYLMAITFVIKIKSGRSFAEHSPILHAISAVSSWQKINSGLLKMFREEVMNKFPVVQHFQFGSLLKWDPPLLNRALPL